MRAVLLGLFAGALLGIASLVLFYRGLATPAGPAREPAQPIEGATTAGGRTTLERHLSTGAPAAVDRVKPTPRPGVEATTPRLPDQIPGMDAQDGLRAALDAHDPQLKQRMLPQLHAALAARASPCGHEQVRRAGHPWMWSAILLIDVNISKQSARITELLFPAGTPDVVGDAQFQACVRARLIGSSMACADCKVGAVSFPYPVAMVPFADDPDIGR